MVDFLQEEAFVPFVDFFCSFGFEYGYQGEKLTFECRIRCAVATFTSLPAAVLGAL
jgi:hypothetical protein